MVEALGKIQSLKPQELNNSGTASRQGEDNIEHSKEQDSNNEVADAEKTFDAQVSLAEKDGEGRPKQPTLESPRIGNPISHGQVVDISKQMKEGGMEPCRLEILLKGSRIYVPPPPPKPEPVSSIPPSSVS